MDNEQRKAQLEQERAWVTGYVKTWKVILDIRNVTGWDDERTQDELMRWRLEGITFDEGFADLTMGQRPEAPFLETPLSS